MRTHVAILLALLATALTAAPASAQTVLVDLGPLGQPLVKSDDGGGDEDRPAATTREAGSLTETSARLNGKVNPHDRPTTYHFDWGLTTAYGSKTPETSAGRGETGVAVAATVTGLTAGTTYHFRVVARNDKGTTAGADMTFTTTAPPAADPGTPPAGDPPPTPGDGTPGDPSGDPAGDPSGGGGDPAGGPTGGDPAGGDGTAGGDDFGSDPRPKLGDVFGAAPAQGTVLLDPPGPAGFSALDAGSIVPMGSVVDARKGTVKITTELDSGRTQTASFWGGVFKVRQRADEGGVTEIVLREKAPDCRSSAQAGKTKLTSAKRKRRRGGLWGRDTKGRWRTRGRGSQATTRGTRWYTEERCEGTFTRVTEGAVEVDDFRLKRKVLVRAGGGYLARVRSARR